MLTAGVDLATQPALTAIATLQWSPGRCDLVSVSPRGTDDLILSTIREVDATGIDAPFGWPDAFVQFVAAHRDDVHSFGSADLDDARRNLSMRVTDQVAASMGHRPLSVSADLIGRTAMRASSLLSRLRDSGTPVDRAGGGRVVEVYPAAALRSWGLRATGYKGDRRSTLPELLGDVLDAAPWLQVGEHRHLLSSSDHAFDALVAALACRAHALGLWVRPGDDQLEQARREGWIILPTGRLGDLID